MDTDQLFQELTADGTYSGRCTVGLENPVGHVTGAATVRIEPNSKNKAELSIEEFQAPPEYDNNLLAFLNASPPKKQGTATVVEISATVDDRRIASLAMTTDKGTFTASSGLLMTPIMMAIQASGHISLILNDLAFVPTDGKSPRYWSIPLQGPFGEHYLGRARAAHAITLGRKDVFAFSANGLPCGLQLFDPEKRPAHPMATFDAVAFGEVQGLPGTLEEIWDSVPSGLVEALSFAVGADVTAPWVELRADDGSLAKRFYFHIGRKSSDDGFPAFSKVNEFAPNSGIGAFLTAFFSLTEDKREALIAPLNLMRSGAPGSFNMEDSITDLVKALDNFCKAHGLTTQDLLVRLDPDNQTKLTTLLTKTRTDLSQIMAENRAAARQGQVDVMNIILSRAANVTSQSRDFGIAVKDLLKELNLNDADVL